MQLSDGFLVLNSVLPQSLCDIPSLFPNPRIDQLALLYRFSHYQERSLRRMLFLRLERVADSGPLPSLQFPVFSSQFALID